jgi:hypothetical protein
VSPQGSAYIVLALGIRGWWPAERLNGEGFIGGAPKRQIQGFPNLWGPKKGKGSDVAGHEKVRVLMLPVMKPPPLDVRPHPDSRIDPYC